MRLWMLLLLISLVKAEITSTTQATVEKGSDSSGESPNTKEKRTPADEASLQNSEYEGYSDEGYEPQQRTQIKNTNSQNSASGPIKQQISYILQDQSRLSYGAASPQVSAGGQVTYIPVRSLLGAQGQSPRYNLPYFPGEQHHPGGTTFTVQYVPPSSIYRSAGNSQKYELVSKGQQASVKAPSPAVQNSLVYIPPGNGYQYLYTNPQYSAAQTQTTYVQPQYTHPAAYAVATPPVPHNTAQSSGGIVYTLQPVVMTFALPGSQYVGPHVGQNHLYSVLAGGGRGAPLPPVVYYPYPQPAIHPVPGTVPYPPQRQVAYVVPSSPYTSSANQRSQQQAVTSRTAPGGSNYASSAPQNVSPAYRVASQTSPNFQQVKG